MLFCALAASLATVALDEKNFGEDVAFLSQHKETIVLSSKDGNAKIAVVPAYQGRVMTSTATGNAGNSYGFIKYDLVASKTPAKAFNPYGGEDRFWMGPEGGQFSIYFPPNSPDQKMERWQVPACIDTDIYRVLEKNSTAVTFQHQVQLTNVSGTKLDVKIDRTVRLIDSSAAATGLGVDFGKAQAVAYESENTITNAGKEPWTKDSGALSIWILGMFKPSPTAAVCIPFKPGAVANAGPIVKDDYFGKVPSERLKMTDKTIFFRIDGQKRTKIGVPPSRALPVAGSWDPSRNVLTIVKTTVPAGATEYVNSQWEVKQEKPFAGDVINSYNDGPSETSDKPFGPFYEIESSSPALFLAPGKSATHTSRTIHLTGPKDDLERVCKHTLGVSLDDIEKAFK